jgi:hypothetical protein
MEALFRAFVGFPFLLSYAQVHAYRLAEISPTEVYLSLREM